MNLCFNESKIKLLTKKQMKRKDGMMKFNMRIQNNHDYVNSDFIVTFILDFIIQWLMSYFSNLFTLYFNKFR